MSKISLHFQRADPCIERFCEIAHPRYVKGVNVYPTYPGVLTIGRPYYNQDLVNGIVSRGVNGADEIWNAVWPEIQKNPQVSLWETPGNEASIWVASIAAQFVAFNQRLIELTHNAGKRIIVGAINTGWPRLFNEDKGKMMEMIRLASRGADGVSFHEYLEFAAWDVVNDCPAGWGNTWGRYRKFHAYCEGRGGHPPIFITECGMDRQGGPDQGHFGWRSMFKDNEDEYVKYLCWYERELQKDDYIKCACIFNIGSWPQFEVTESLALKLARVLANLQPIPPAPTPDNRDQKIIALLKQAIAMLEA